MNKCDDCPYNKKLIYIDVDDESEWYSNRCTKKVFLKLFCKKNKNHKPIKYVSELTEYLNTIEKRLEECEKKLDEE